MSIKVGLTLVVNLMKIKMIIQVVKKYIEAREKISQMRMGSHH